MGVLDVVQAQFTFHKRKYTFYFVAEISMYLKTLAAVFNEL